MVKTANSSSTSQQASEPKYTGVRKRKWGKWVSEIRLPNSRERIWLGSYDSAEKAARAFDAALYCLRGPSARFNFPDNPPDIAGGESLSPQEIQVAAARFANETRSITATPTANSSTTSTSTSMPELSSQFMDHYYASASSASDGAIQVDNASDRTGIDWSFLDVLDLNEGSEFGLYPSLGNNYSDYYPPPPSIFDDGTRDNNDDDDHENDGNEAYSQPSFLWNF
ncbi:ethylene-responsive transcription factor ERF017 [Ricinus communis]|nr:ethylene-responsive transcription factor ERF017 [Ricinus communis]|eukprot:XP_002516165.2 ethylene-responsive transcription factor ERF017 [Ricinus communis]